MVEQKGACRKNTIFHRHLQTSACSVCLRLFCFPPPSSATLTVETCGERILVHDSDVA